MYCRVALLNQSRWLGTRCVNLICVQLLDLYHAAYAHIRCALQPSEARSGASASESSPSIWPSLRDAKDQKAPKKTAPASIARPEFPDRQVNQVVTCFRCCACCFILVVSHVVYNHNRRQNFEHCSPSIQHSWRSQTPATACQSSAFAPCSVF